MNSINNNSNKRTGKGFAAVKKPKYVEEPAKPEIAIQASESNVHELGPSFNQIADSCKKLSDLSAHLKTLETKQLPQKSALEEAVAKIMNKDHSLALSGRGLTVIFKSIDDKGYPEVRFVTDGAMAKFYANLKLPYKVETDEGSKKKLLPSFESWVNHEESARHLGITFNPRVVGDVNGYFNMWSGFKLEKKDGTDKCQGLLDHMKNIYCNGNEDHYKYLLGWLAHMIQKPWEKPGVAVILQSKEKGTGKSTLFDLFIKPLLGHRAAMSTSQPEHVIGRFNGHLIEKICLVLEEATFAGSNHGDSVIKDLITSKNLTIEQKHQDPITADSFLRIINITNNEWAVKSSSDERRYFVLKLDPSKAQNKSYFDPIYEDMRDGGAEQMFNYLSDFDISDFNPLVAPMTDAGKEQVALTMSNENKFICQAMQDFEVDGLSLEYAITKKEFYSAYVKFVQTVGYQKALDQTSFTKSLKNALGELFKLTKGHERSLDGVPNKQLPRSGAWTFRAKEDCQERLIENLNLPYTYFEE